MTDPADFIRRAKAVMESSFANTIPHGPLLAEAIQIIEHLTALTPQPGAPYSPPVEVPYSPWVRHP